MVGFLHRREVVPAVVPAQSLTGRDAAKRACQVFCEGRISVVRFGVLPGKLT